MLLKVWTHVFLFVFLFQSAQPWSDSAPHGSETQQKITGTSLVRFAQIDNGVFKGSEPKSDADYRFLQSIGIKHIVALRFFPILPVVETHKAKRYGMTVISIPMNASPIAPSEKHVDRALCWLRNPQVRPVYLHCDIGRDRTSLVATLYEIYFRGLPATNAWSEMRRFGFKNSWTTRGLRTYLRKHAAEAQRGKGAPNCSATETPSK